ncbi:endomembrane protein 70, putative [Bodo saltans]|uniref:Endomembrane protein 70, putative n=1 Tax=Bodo saltans TaxID=75058 RepID=A0A0S4ITP7_BODSA|nr:endomembrane protein 70, putative [Bodo saltans]|eukprot:CUF89152.1 endomembrane protein 70, putative [Bodo saltans]
MVVCLTVTVDAFRSARGLRSIVNKAVDATSAVGDLDNQVESSRPQPITGPGAASSTTAFRARKIATTPDEVNKNVVFHGMKFTLREDHRCFVVEVDRPGDHAACTFRYTSNITDRDTRNRIGRNVSVEWFSPLGISVAEFTFSPQHRCAERGRCLVRATPIAAESASQGLHGVVSGAYSLCFRMTGPSLIAKIFQAFSSNKASHEDLTIELLELSTESLMPPSMDSPSKVLENSGKQRTGGKKKATRVVGAGSVPQKLPGDQAHVAPAATVQKLTSMENRIRLLNAEIESIVRESAFSEERQQSFDQLSNSLFTRIWACGVATIAAMMAVLWGQSFVLRRHLVKKKLV